MPMKGRERRRAAETSDPTPNPKSGAKNRGRTSWTAAVILAFQPTLAITNISFVIVQAIAGFIEKVYPLTVGDKKLKQAHR